MIIRYVLAVLCDTTVTVVSLESNFAIDLS